MGERLSADDRARIEAAIRNAEARADAHVAFVAVPASDHYALYPIVWAALIVLAAAGIAAFAWPQITFRQGFTAEAVLFVALSLLLEWQPLKLLLVPKRAKRLHAEQLAQREFAARILGSSERQGGVLLFISLAERYAQIIADRRAHERVGQVVWDDAHANFAAAAKAGRIADGAVAAIETCGIALESHRPRQ